MVDCLFLSTGTAFFFLKEKSFYGLRFNILMISRFLKSKTTNIFKKSSSFKQQVRYSSIYSEWKPHCPTWINKDTKVICQGFTGQQV